MVHNDKLQVINEVEKALDEILYGSVELFVQDGNVTQITVRRIQKTGVTLGNHSDQNISTGNNYPLKSSGKLKANINSKIGIDKNF